MASNTIETEYKDLWLHSEQDGPFGRHSAPEGPLCTWQRATCDNSGIPAHGRCPNERRGPQASFSVFTFNGLKITLYVRLNGPNKTLDQGMTMETVKKLLLTAEIKGDMKAATQTIAKLQQNALKSKTTG